MRGRSPELLEADVLAGDGLHDVGPGDEHVRGLLHHQHEVRHRRRVHGAARAWAHDERDLRHDAGGLDVPPEDLRIAGERDDPLLDPRSARVVDPDHRAAVLHRQVHHLADLLGEDLRERATEDSEVLGEDEDPAIEDRPVAGHHRVAPGPVLAHPELGLAVPHETVELDERARVEQLLETLPGEQLSALTLARDVLLAARVEPTPRAAPRANEAWLRSCRGSPPSAPSLMPSRTVERLAPTCRVYRDRHCKDERPR